jgi:hypothetical protein
LIAAVPGVLSKAEAEHLRRRSFDVLDKAESPKMQISRPVCIFYGRGVRVFESSGLNALRLISHSKAPSG